MRRWVSRVVAVALVLGACGGVAVDPLFVAASGGAATVEAVGDDAFSRPIAGLADVDVAAFDIGNRFFREEWESAPGASDTDGLGPSFNARSCVACHVGDGRSMGPEAGELRRPGLIVFLEHAGGTDPSYGSQIQDLAIDGVPPEAVVMVAYDEVSLVHPAGTTVSLRRPAVTPAGLAFGPIDAATHLSPRVAPPLVGLGLLEAVPSEVIAEYADPGDRDGDGISGNMPAGRFGWKGDVSTLEAQTVRAFNHDLGITSPASPDEDCPSPQEACAAAPSGGSPEVGQGRIDAIVAYLRTLAVPARRSLDDPAVRRGGELFVAAGCDGCHRPTMSTGAAPGAMPIGQQIHPFTDLLLHDMGPGLADGGPKGAEWRTPPLWGIGLTGVVGGHTTFLHDGRARSLEEAVLWHGGEAAASQRAFVEMTSDEREALIAFLRSL